MAEVRPEPNRKNLTHEQRRALAHLEAAGYVLLHGGSGYPGQGTAHKRTLQSLVDRGLARWSPDVAGWPKVIPMPPTRLEVKIRQSDMTDFGWSTDKHLVLIAFHDKNPLGVLHVQPEGEYAVIQFMWVKPKYRRREVAKQLVDAAAKRTGLTVAHDNRLSLDGSRFARATKLTKLHYPFQRITAARAEASGQNLLINAGGVLIPEGESTT